MHKKNEKPANGFMKPKKRASIPQAVREQTWNKWCKQVYFKRKCYVKWCKNIITPFTFQAGHVISNAKGGDTNVNNLRPICTACNLGMGTMCMREWSRKYNPKKTKKIK